MNDLKILRLDHFVLTVKSIEVSCAFYQRCARYGDLKPLEKEERLQNLGQQKINFHQAGQEIDPKAKSPLSGSSDMCFITNESESSLIEMLQTNGVAIIWLSKRTGALGPILSVYISSILDWNLIDRSEL